MPAAPSPLTVVVGSGGSPGEERLLDDLLRAGRAEQRLIALAWVGPHERPTDGPLARPGAIDADLDLHDAWDRSPLRLVRALRQSAIGSRAKDAVVKTWLRRMAKGPVVVLGSGVALLPWLGGHDTVLVHAVDDPRLEGSAPDLSGRTRLLITTPAVRAAADRWQVTDGDRLTVWGWRPAPAETASGPTVVVAGPPDWDHGADLAARTLSALVRASTDAARPSVRWIAPEAPSPSAALAVDLERLGVGDRIEWVAADPAVVESWTGAGVALLPGRQPQPAWCDTATEAGIAVVGFPTGVTDPVPGRDQAVAFGDVAAAAEALAAAHPPAPSGITVLEAGA